MKITSSEVITIDGEAKCGKTTAMAAIRRHAVVAQNLGELAAQATKEKYGWSDDHLSIRKVRDLGNMTRFDSIVQISAGNFYRAAAAYVIDEEKRYKSKGSFCAEDAERVQEIIASKGGLEMLQNDPEIEKRVSDIAQLEGAHTLCGSLFATAVQEAYLQDGKSNLVLADARDPVGHFRRNNLLGALPHQIHPASIVPIYIDTPIEVAARRMKGDYEENCRNVSGRRRADRERAEVPVIPPTSDQVITDLGVYRAQFYEPKSTEVALPYLIDNGDKTSLEMIERIGSLMAHIANDAGIMRYYAQNSA